MSDRYTISPAGENASSGMARWHAPAGLYLTRGDGVALPVAAEMLARWIGLGRGHPLRLDDIAAENILLGMTREQPLGDP